MTSLSASLLRYVYDALDDFAPVACSYGHSSAITHLDWSASSDVDTDELGPRDLDGLWMATDER